MIEFHILKKSRRSRARLGVLKTPHGEVETPAFVPVATQAVVKTLTSQEVRETGSRILICNTFHLHLKPGEKFVRKAGDLHRFMNWKHPLMTDSGGFQVFSMGFGKDYGIGKVMKRQSVYGGVNVIRENSRPKLLKITSDGVIFRSPLDGKEIFLGPQESIRIQEDLGADIIFAFDECPPPLADLSYHRKALERTHRWAMESLKAQRFDQGIFGIVQGGRFLSLRKESARFIGSLAFDGFGIGGEFGINKQSMTRILQTVFRELPEGKPRHLLGIGYLEDIPRIIAGGIDLFDCIVPTRFARHGVAFTSSGRIDLGKSIFLKDQNPLDPSCSCSVCGTYRRSYVAHLVRAKEITASRLLTFHNLAFFQAMIASVRQKMRQGEF